MDVKDLNGSLNELREKFLTGKISRRDFLAKLGRMGLAAPVALYVAKLSGIFGAEHAYAGTKKTQKTGSSDAAEEALSLKMLEPIKLRDNKKYKTKPPWRVGFANPGINNPWRVCFQACVEYQKSLTPEIKEFYQTDAGEKAEKQISDIEDLMGKKLDAIMVNPATSEALKPIMEEIYAKGVPSVTVDRWVDTDKVTCRTSSELASNAIRVSTSCSRRSVYSGGKWHVVQRLISGISRPSLVRVRSKIALPRRCASVNGAPRGRWRLGGRGIVQMYRSRSASSSGVYGWSRVKNDESRAPH